MSVLSSTVLFGQPKCEIARLLVERMDRASAIRIVTRFATPGGLSTITGPISANPNRLQTLATGAATYKGFETLDVIFDLVKSACFYLPL